MLITLLLRSAIMEHLGRYMICKISPDPRFPPSFKGSKVDLGPSKPASLFDYCSSNGKTYPFLSPSATTLSWVSTAMIRYSLSSMAGFHEYTYLSNVVSIIPN